MLKRLAPDTISMMRLYDTHERRLYLNAAERARFLRVADKADDQIRSFCLTLFYTGCRLSEARALVTDSIQLEARLISFRTLKKRQQVQIREVPIPEVLATTLSDVFDLKSCQYDQSNGQPLWLCDGQPINRSTGYRWVKLVMKGAGIRGKQACPKGLRHGYGMHAIQSGVQLHMLQKWMGHASMSTTAIYANAVGREEMMIAERMWG